jgi:hypothetical protein
MATYNWGVDRTFKAGMPNLGNYQYGFVQLNGTSACMVINASTIGGSVLGVLQNDPVAASDLAVVRVLGFSKIRTDTENAASPIVVGNWVKTASNGWAIGCAADEFAVAASTWCAGIAMESASSASGQYIEIFIKPMALPCT